MKNRMYIFLAGFVLFFFPDFLLAQTRDFESLLGDTLIVEKGTADLYEWKRLDLKSGRKLRRGDLIKIDKIDGDWIEIQFLKTGDSKWLRKDSVSKSQIVFKKSEMNLNLYVQLLEVRIQELEGKIAELQKSMEGIENQYRKLQSKYAQLEAGNKIISSSAFDLSTPDAFGVYVKKGRHFYPLSRFEEDFSLKRAAKKALIQERVIASNNDQVVFYMEGINPSRIEMANAVTAERVSPQIRPGRKSGLYIIDLRSLSSGKYFIFIDNAVGFTAWCWGTVEIQ